MAGLPLEAVQTRIADLGVPADLAPHFWSVMRENITVLDDLGPWWALCRDGADPVVDDEDTEFVAQAVAMLPDMPFTPDTWGQWTGAVKEATGRKGRSLFMPLRKALTGQAHGPDMGSLMPLLQAVKAKG